MHWLKDFQNQCPVACQKKISGRKLTTFAIGGDLDLLVEPNSITELGALLAYLYQNQLPYRILGAGSNLLIPDQGVAVPVIKLGKAFRYYLAIDQTTFEVGASMPLMVLSRELSRAGFSGLEFAGGIPASFGGAVRMNAGAHTGEMSQILARVNYLDVTGKECSVAADQLEFSYRHNSLPVSSVITSALIKLIPGDSTLILENQQRHLSYRKLTQPLTLASAGSIFKNPEGHYAGALIEKLGLKGTIIGQAMISEMHANWIVNPNKNALAEDVKSLISLVKTRILQDFQINLETELQIW